MRSVVVWQLQDDALVAQTCVWPSSEQPEQPAGAEPSAAAFDRSGALLALAVGRLVRVFVVARRELLLTLEGHAAKVRSSSCSS